MGSIMYPIHIERPFNELFNSLINGRHDPCYIYYGVNRCIYDFRMIDKLNNLNEITRSVTYV